MSANMTQAPANAFAQGSGIICHDPSRSLGPIALPNGIIQLCLRNGIRFLSPHKI